MNTKPYVVSGDIYLLLAKWAMRRGLVLPSQKFFIRLRERFSEYMTEIFPNFELVLEEEIVAHMKAITSQCGLPCISLDQVYSSTDYTLELTRTVDANRFDQGLYSRSESNPFLQQLKHVKNQGLTKVCLVDDVVFSGDLVDRVIKLLSSVGIEVPVVCAGIGIQKGIDRICSSNRKVYCARLYAEVIDEVCERDFYLGIPYSGRSLMGGDNIGFPYFLPFGKPDEWASIPVVKQKDFSEFCILQTIILFKEMEKCSGRVIYNADIERKVTGQPQNGRYVDFLSSIKV